MGMPADSCYSDFKWGRSSPHTEGFLYEPLKFLLAKHGAPGSKGLPVRVLDLGCGNGALASEMCRWGYDVVGVDPSASGVKQSRARCPDLSFFQAFAEPEQLVALGLSCFDVVVSTEVVEHCYAPRQWAASAFEVLRPGGVLICSTPYHGYLKNVALALSGKLDDHFTALWDGGHIKFWSRATLGRLLEEAGFTVTAFRGAGRCPWLWKSMLIAARKPSS